MIIENQTSMNIKTHIDESRTVLDLQVVRINNDATFQSKVSNLAKDGYTPCSDLVISAPIYIQYFVKYAPKEEPQPPAHPLAIHWAEPDPEAGNAIHGKVHGVDLVYVITPQPDGSASLYSEDELLTTSHNIDGAKAWAQNDVFAHAKKWWRLFFSAVIPR